ncbi:MAG: S8 family serine peptidase [Armatimonadetes bacterium]|nr:S8 family serine peptidase [Armatimonadota bacterium]
MKRRNLSAFCLPAVILLLATLCGCAGGSAPGISAIPQQDSLIPSSRAADGSVTYLVLAKQGKYDKVKSQVAATGARIDQEMPELDALTAASSDPTFAATLSSTADVDGVAEDQETSALDETFLPVDAGTVTATDPSFPTPQDSLYGLQWDIRRIGGTLQKAWAVTTGNHTIRVAVMDTGIHAEHPDLAPNLLVSLSRNFVTNSPPQDPADLSLRDLAGHGTFTASQIAGAFGGGEIVGIGPGLSVVSVKMINKNGRLWFSWALPALYYAAANRFEVINMSWSGVIDTSTPETMVRDLPEQKFEGCRQSFQRS